MTDKLSEKQDNRAPDIPRTTMADTQSNTKPTLLGIAPELRNRIYYAALTHHNPLDITHVACRKEPALLSVCRQIRNESIGIYYTDNSFIFECCKLDFRKLLPFCEHQQRYHAERKLKVQVSMYRHAKIYDFCYFDRAEYVRAWLERYHKYPENTPRPCEKPKSDKHIVEAFDVIDTMRDRAWSAVEEKLSHIFRNIVWDHWESQSEDEFDSA